MYLRWLRERDVFVAPYSDIVRMLMQDPVVLLEHTSAVVVAVAAVAAFDCRIVAYCWAPTNTVEYQDVAAIVVAWPVEVVHGVVLIAVAVADALSFVERAAVAFVDVDLSLDRWFAFVVAYLAMAAVVTDPAIRRADRFYRRPELCPIVRSPFAIRALDSIELECVRVSRDWVYRRVGTSLSADDATMSFYWTAPHCRCPFPMPFSQIQCNGRCDWTAVPTHPSSRSAPSICCRWPRSNERPIVFREHWPLLWFSWPFLWCLWPILSFCRWTIVDVRQ